MVTIRRNRQVYEVRDKAWVNHSLFGYIKLTALSNGTHPNPSIYAKDLLPPQHTGPSTAQMNSAQSVQGQNLTSIRKGANSS